MQGPSTLLSVLKSKSSNKDYVFKDLYRMLYNPNFHLRAYTKLAPNTGNMTAGTDGNTIDGFGTERIMKVIAKLRDESYQPAPVRRIYIPKRNSDKKRPLGIPTFDDKVVQDLIRVILEAIYEDTFSDFSHAYRPNRSCHTCLAQIKTLGKSTKWWIEGDIKGFFDKINHEIMISILRKRIKDERFLNLIRKFLNAGYMEDWKFENTYSGTPQGGVLSPILSNIYLNEFDRFMENLIETFNKGKERGYSRAYMNATSKAGQRRKKYKESDDPSRREQLLKEIKALEKEYRSISSKDDMDDSFKRLKYFRYADDFLISVIGSKEDAIVIKEQIKNFLQNGLKLELSEEKTLITHNTKPIRFLGYDIKINHSQEVLNTAKGKVRQLSGNVLLAMPHDRIRDFMLRNCFMKIKEDGTWKATHVKKYLNYSKLEILRTYNSQIKGFYEYYKLANNIFRFHNPYFLIHQSFQKTLANKGKTTSKKIRDSHTFDGKLGVEYRNKKGNMKIAYLFKGPFERVDVPNTNEQIDFIPNWMTYFTGTSLEDRILANKCEWCGTEEGQFEVHHVRKLKELKGKRLWEKIMIARVRKTMVLCKRWHVDLHAGRLD
ncbi:reverse transcriptase domain-containing protein [Brevibacillus halotolerans]|uniref:reverse transcriptase/maturase family protein n=1 Tax=Brevibacillus TaxID=55080 RepID=UPI00215C3480|nr:MULTISPECIES: reverse transcriptase/maturase family protein [Brevibacillus]MCR8964171.1 reverse transcriptase domain-containing protein [Brevibacillus laterosporus]MCZ0836326.1 reverse transcriptase domain-containing protein [Brevibacillus halotolerans]